MKHKPAEETIVTESLGFPLSVSIIFRKTGRNLLGRHSTYEKDGQVPSAVPHKLIFNSALENDEQFADVAAHEVYHLFYSVRHLITASEEVQAEVFGNLIGRIHALRTNENHP